MSPRIVHHAANDAHFFVFPLCRPRPHLALAGVASPTPLHGVEFVVASHADDFDEASALTTRCYGWRGYRLGTPSSARGELTLLARHGGKVIGTITVRGGVHVRLQAETGFPEQIGALRRPGRRLVEYTRFAIDREALARIGHGADVAPELIRRALLLGRLSLCATDCVIEVNPRHARYYRRRFGFTEYGPERACERVGAPARLLHLSFDGAPGGIAPAVRMRPEQSAH